PAESPKSKENGRGHVRLAIHCGLRPEKSLRSLQESHKVSPCFRQFSHIRVRRRPSRSFGPSPWRTALSLKNASLLVEFPGTVIWLLTRHWAMTGLARDCITSMVSLKL